MDARLGGMKEALKPRANQYPLWEAFEEAVRNAEKARTDDMRETMQNRERMSPVERLDAVAGRMGRRAAEVKTIAEAAKPFYASLDEIQKRNFAMLGREMLTAGAAQCGRIQREKPAARGCQRIGIGCNSHDVSALTGLFARALAGRARNQGRIDPSAIQGESPKARVAASGMFETSLADDGTATNLSEAAADRRPQS
jgi:hypothetical protein